MYYLYSMVVASESEILSALIFENGELFESICNPQVSESEGNESNDGNAPEKPDFQFRDQFGEKLSFAFSASYFSII